MSQIISQVEDTSEDVAKLHAELLSNLSLEEKLRQISLVSKMARSLTLGALRAAQPDISFAELLRKYALRTLTEEEFALIDCAEFRSIE